MVQLAASVIELLSELLDLYKCNMGLHPRGIHNKNHHGRSWSPPCRLVCYHLWLLLTFGCLTCALCTLILRQTIEQS
jgi:hypothetical protein